MHQLGGSMQRGCTGLLLACVMCCLGPVLLGYCGTQQANSGALVRALSGGVEGCMLQLFVHLVAYLPHALPAAAGTHLQACLWPHLR
jgi:hypothetical protein